MNLDNFELDEPPIDRRKIRFRYRAPLMAQSYRLWYGNRWAAFWGTPPDRVLEFQRAARGVCPIASWGIRADRASSPSWLRDPILAPALRTGCTLGCQVGVPIVLLDLIATQWMRGHGGGCHEELSLVDAMTRRLAE